MFGPYRVAHILGIAREHEQNFRECEKFLTLEGFICFTPVFYDINIYKQYPEMLDNMCYEKLKVCDFCVLATPDHIGKSTEHRIRQSLEMGKPVYVWDGEDYKDNEIKTEEDLQQWKERGT